MIIPKLAAILYVLHFVISLGKILPLKLGVENAIKLPTNGSRFRRCIDPRFVWLT